MKANYSKLLTKLASVVGLASVSLLITLPSQANQSTNNLVAQAGSGILNPRPSIFNEPPYNRGPRTTTPATPTPRVTPTPPTTRPGAGTTDTQNKTLLGLAESSPNFKTLTAALKAAGLTETLQGRDNLTVFAPTDAAFAKLPADAVRDLLKPENKEILLQLLTYHVVNGTVLSTDLKSGDVQSLEGGKIKVTVGSNGVMVNDANVVQADIKGSNGVIHAIDQVILPPDL
ncbi:fasciclin domain-containing protein [Nodularia sphaerocarpa]|uniref:fasciclin domain-containing protein n=1 Tax=Nodularia sphaerocarpa TaxID=137816 RepID=UPI001EFB6C46|nr:fasciclin domain-containing protein [Nodularia sphaerocarpa]MDB9373305.1 fasciclin domain-containing protein [Nodularia sphaerocarpa CS-585]MDB9379642.1 fasciclin domain-containing protein [Nodularia sphaerocarpa CS-585A2]ULP73185.1 Immunogenic protein MPB70 [Nodularia sphaerocarpa UHCC 0038]